MTKVIISILLSCFILSGYAQKANYELAEKMTTNKLEYDYQKLHIVHAPNSENFWFRIKTQDGEKYFYADVAAKKTEPLFDANYISYELTKITGRTYSPNKLGFYGTPFKKDGVTLYWSDGKYMIEYNRLTKKLTHSEIEASTRDSMRMMGPQSFRDLSQSPDGKYQVYSHMYNLYLRDLSDSTAVQLTFGGEKDYAYGYDYNINEKQNLPVVWSSDSKRFYHFCHDTRDIAEVSVMNYLNGRPVAGNTQMILAGDSGVLRTELSLFDAIEKKQIKIKLEKWKDQMSRILQTSDDLQEFYIERKNRPCDLLEICKVDVETGEVKVLIEENIKPYVGIETCNISFFNDSKDLIFLSERTGYAHLYRYDENGNLKNTITSGDWGVGRIIKFDEKKREIYFEAYGYTPGENPSYAKVCKANIDGKGKVVLLTPEEATHLVQFSPSGKYFIDTFSRPDLPTQFVLRNDKGNFIMQLGEADISNLYKNGWKLPETFSVKAADNKTELYGVMWKPFDFDETKKYPIISCVYPGPQTDNVPLSFEFNSENELLAQVGFIVVAFNHRGGLPFRGKDYRTFGYGNIRDHALADDKYGLEQLIERHSFIDGGKVGVYGHSGGGFMSTSAICTYPDFYQVGVSSAGNHDNNIYSQFFVETHHGIREVIKGSPEGEETSINTDTEAIENVTFELIDIPTNMEIAKNLKGHLMLVVGGYDGNVLPANTFRMVDAFINHGKDIEFVYLPQARHVYEGVSSWYFRHKMWSHFAKYLLGDFTTPAFYDIEFDERMNQVKRVL